MIVRSGMIANHVNKRTTRGGYRPQTPVIDQTNLSSITPHASTCKLLDGQQQTCIVKFLAVLTPKMLHFGNVMMDDVSDA